jgi:dihydrofolate reductase
MSIEVRPASQSTGNIEPGRSPQIVLVVAAASNGVIGRDNALPWRLPDDLKRFKSLTLGKPVIMGRKTYESIGRPLPGRMNIVLSRAAQFAPPGVTVVSSLDAALAAVGDAPEVAVIGGAALYREALPRASIVHLTRVHADVSGDARLDPIDANAWEEESAEYHAADDRHAYAMTFVTLRRRNRTP